MENSKRLVDDVLNGSASSRQRLHRREGATRDVSTAPEHRVNLVQCLRSSSTLIHRQLPSCPRRQIDNDDIIASIDWTDQSLTNCLSLTESALAMIQIRSSSEANLRERLARAEDRITGKTATIISFPFFLTLPSRSSDQPFL